MLVTRLKFKWSDGSFTNFTYDSEMANIFKDYNSSCNSICNRILHVANSCNMGMRDLPDMHA